MAIEKLNIEKKQDNATRISQIVKANLPHKEFLQSSEFNAVVDKVNEMIPELNAGVSGYQGKIYPTDKKDAIGFYFAAESGVYPYAGNFTINIAEGINHLMFDGTKWDKMLTPIEATGKVEEGNKGIVSGEEVWNNKKRVFNLESTPIEYNQFDYKFINNFITDATVIGVTENIFKINSICFDHPVYRDFISFEEGSIDNKGVIEWGINRHILFDKETNPQYPTDYSGEHTVKYELNNRITIVITFNFNNINISKGDIIEIGSIGRYGENVFFSNKIDKKYFDLLKPKIFVNTSKIAGYDEEKKLLNNIIKDIKVIGLLKNEIIGINSICFDHPVYRDFVNFRKGYIDNKGVIKWTDFYILFDKETNPQYPTDYSGEHTVKYELNNRITIVITFNFNNVSKGLILNMSDSKYSKDSFISHNYINYIVKNTAGKKVLIFADSISDTRGGKVTWVQRAMKILGISDYVNYGFSGAAFRNRNIDGVLDLPQQLEEAKNQKSVDFVILFVGTNEYHYDAPNNNPNNNMPIVGSYITTMNKSIDTIINNVFTLGVRCEMYDAIRYGLNYIQETWNCPVFICSTTQRADFDMTQQDTINNALELLGKRYGAYFIDLRDCGIVKDFEKWQAEGRDLIDGLHPKNTKAYNKIGNKIISEIINRYVD